MTPPGWSNEDLQKRILKRSKELEYGFYDFSLTTGDVEQARERLVETGTLVIAGLLPVQVFDAVTDTFFKRIYDATEQDFYMRFGLREEVLVSPFDNSRAKRFVIVDRLNDEDEHAWFTQKEKDYIEERWTNQLKQEIKAGLTGAAVAVEKFGWFPLTISEILIMIERSRVITLSRNVTVTNATNYTATQLDGLEFLRSMKKRRGGKPRK